MPGGVRRRCRVTGCLVTACRVAQRPQGKDADCGFELGWHRHRTEPTGRQHRQQQPAGRRRIGVGTDVARTLGAPDQVGEVSGDRPHRIPGGDGQIRVRGQRRGVSEQHSVGGPGVGGPGVGGPGVGGPGVGGVPGQASPVRWPARRLGEYPGQQPRRGVGPVGQVVQ